MVRSTSENRYEILIDEVVSKKSNGIEVQGYAPYFACAAQIPKFNCFIRPLLLLFLPSMLLTIGYRVTHVDTFINDWCKIAERAIR